MHREVRSVNLLDVPFRSSNICYVLVDEMPVKLVPRLLVIMSVAHSFETRHAGLAGPAAAGAFSLTCSLAYHENCSNKGLLAGKLLFPVWIYS